MKLIYSLEDDKSISDIIFQTLTKTGYHVKCFYDATSFFKAFNEQKPDMVLLDMMLPDMPGEEVLSILRDDILNNNIHIIVITANRLITDKVKSFDLGADDYIEKPFHLLELMSRVGAKFRKEQAKELVIKNLCINLDTMSVFVDNKAVSLTPKEFQILVYLAKNQGKVVSREDLQKEVWNTDVIIESRTIDMHVLNIRDKINIDLIKTVYGVGYIIYE